VTLCCFDPWIILIKCSWSVQHLLCATGTYRLITNAYQSRSLQGSLWEPSWFLVEKVSLGQIYHKSSFVLSHNYTSYLYVSVPAVAVCTSPGWLVCYCSSPGVPIFSRNIGTTFKFLGARRVIRSKFLLRTQNCILTCDAYCYLTISAWCLSTGTHFST